MAIKTIESLSHSRILPSVEAYTIFPSSGSIDFTNDFKRIDSLHVELGIKLGQRLAHDVAKDRARYERAKDEVEKQAVKEGIITNIEKTLYERAHTTKSPVTYQQNKEGRIYDPGHPGESIDVIFQRGVKDSKRHKFVDYEREVEEFEGWKEVMTVLFSAETPIGSKEIFISGPGLKKGTQFTDNFVDIFTKAIDPATGRVIVTQARFASGSSYEEYKSIAVRLDDNYFSAGKAPDDKEIDIYFKRHPIFIDSRIDSKTAQQLFNDEFTKQKGATEEEKTKNYLDECRINILHYAEAVCSGFFKPEAVKEAFNTVINKFDSLRKGLMGISGFGRKALGFLNTVQEDINHYGRMKVEEMMVGCGMSGGFSIGGSGFSISGIISSAGRLISGAIRGILSLFKDKDHCIHCGACGAYINRIVRRGEKCPVCPAVRRC